MLLFKILYVYFFVMSTLTNNLYSTEHCYHLPHGHHHLHNFLHRRSLHLNFLLLEFHLLHHCLHLPHQTFLSFIRPLSHQYPHHSPLHFHSHRPHLFNFYFNTCLYSTLFNFNTFLYSILYNFNIFFLNFSLPLHNFLLHYHLSYSFYIFCFFPYVFPRLLQSAHCTVHISFVLKFLK